MKKMILLIFLLSCTSPKISSEKINFDKDMSYEEFKILLQKYDKVSGYPDINN